MIQVKNLICGFGAGRSSRPWPPMLLALAIGCGAPPARPEVIEDPSASDVYPNRRQPIELPRGDVGFVTNRGSDSITILNLETGSVIATRAVGRVPVDLDGPRHLVVDRLHGVLYVAFSYPEPELVPGPHTAHNPGHRNGFVQKLALSDLSLLGETRVDDSPAELELSADGAKLVVTHFDAARTIVDAGPLEARRATLAILDPAEMRLEGSPEPRRISVCVQPEGLALSRPDARLAYVACYGDDAVAVVDLTAADQSVSFIPLSADTHVGAPVVGPYAAALSESGRLLFVGEARSHAVTFIDTDSARVLKSSTNLTSTPLFGSWGRSDARLYVPARDPDELVAIDPSTGEVSMRRAFDEETCMKPHEAVLSTDQRIVYLVCEGDHVSPGTVLGLDADSLETLTRYEVGIDPDRLAVQAAP